jgi:hypothetical protein
MKVNELMIGDWVKINDVDYPNPAKIGGVTKKGGEYYACFPQWDLLVACEKLHPIPLTEEVMRKYFPHADLLAWSEMRDLDYGITFHIAIEYEGLHVVFPHTRYIHELQNLLNISGINIEIEL